MLGGLAGRCGVVARHLPDQPADRRRHRLADPGGRAREPRPGRPEHLDWRGAILAAAGLRRRRPGGLTAAGERGWRSVAVWSALVAGIAILAGFVALQAREKHPMMPLSLYRSATFSAPTC
ncbi:hypothetical protein ACRAWD_12145 [Caulobacter segnis]